MKETIYLVVSRNKVERMTKNLPSIYKGEVPVRVNVEVDEKAFRPPVIEKDVYIEDWRDGIDIEDVEFEGTAITKDEAEIIRQRRLERMKEILEGQGYQVSKPEEDSSEEETN